MGSATVAPPLPPGFQLDAPQTSQTSPTSSGTPPLPAGFSLDAPTSGPTLAPQPELTPQAEDTIAQATSGGNPITEVGNRYLTIPVVKALLKVHDAIQSAQDLTEAGREQHPVEAKLGDLSAAIEGLLTGNQDRPDESIGTGEYGVVNNPVTQAVTIGVDGPESIPQVAEKAAGVGSKASEAVASAAQRVPNAAKAIVASASKGKEALETAATAANDTPIDITKPLAIAKEIQEEGSHGATIPKVVNDFVAKAESGEPITYKSGRKFYTHSGSLSDIERSSLDGPTQHLVDQFNSALDEANHAAAAKAGAGDAYRTGMEQTRLAANRGRAAEHLGRIPAVGKTVKESSAALKDLSAGAKVRPVLNGSGESEASLEAIRSGQKFRIVNDRTGATRPVSAVDARGSMRTNPNEHIEVSDNGSWIRYR